MCKIAILEKYSLFSSGIKSILNDFNECEIIAEVKHAVELSPQFQATKPDVIIIDIIHCECEGVKAIKKVRQSYLRVPVLLIVSEDYANSFEDYISLGVQGFVFNNASAEELIQAVKTLKKGEDYFTQKVWSLLKDYLRSRKSGISEKNKNAVLTNREVSVLKLFCRGLTYKEIGVDLNISPRTVETHKKNISTKLNIRSTAEMIQYAMHNNLN